MDPLGDVLGVWAHPDDETFLSAGLMMRALAEGGRVVCVTATRGEAGSFDEERYPSERMGEIRERELLASLDVLGVRDHRFLDYVDGTCAQVAEEEPIETIAVIIDQVRPDTVLTFPPDGLTGHDDHRSVSRWTSAAFARAARPGARLHHAAVTQAWCDAYLELERGWGVFAPGTPTVTPADGLSIEYGLPPREMDTKLQAIRAQWSQVEEVVETLGLDFFRGEAGTETFVLAAVGE